MNLGIKVDKNLKKAYDEHRIGNWKAVSDILAQTMGMSIRLEAIKEKKDEIQESLEAHG